MKMKKKNSQRKRNGMRGKNDRNQNEERRNYIINIGEREIDIAIYI